MNIKTYMAAAVAALTLAACAAKSENELINIDEAAPAQSELNEDGSINTDEAVEDTPSQ